MLHCNYVLRFEIYNYGNSANLGYDLFDYLIQEVGNLYVNYVVQYPFMTENLRNNCDKNNDCHRYMSRKNFIVLILQLFACVLVQGIYFQ